jgi:tRNA threonylcarbamoyladenosine biosynthesis protein TsaE
MFKRYLQDQAATEAFGGQLAAACTGGLLVYLHGQLGAGKTTLVRGFLRTSGHSGPVKSPTYTLVEPYSTARGNIFHLDLYRLADAEELEWIGIRDLFEDESICLVEWPEQGAGILPEPDLHVYLQVEGGGRGVRVEASSPHGEQLVRIVTLNQQAGA